MENREFTKALNRVLLKLLGVGAMVVILISLNGCEKECSCEPKDTVVVDSYYVKYKVQKSTIYLGQKNDITIVNENNANVTFSNVEGGSWEEIIGPVERGFFSSLSVSAVDTTHNKLKLNAYIYVSKNGEPFVLKQSDTIWILGIKFPLIMLSIFKILFVKDRNYWYFFS